VHLYLSSGTGSTPAAGFGSFLVETAIPHSTNRELAPDDESGGHRPCGPVCACHRAASMSESHGSSSRIRRAKATQAAHEVEAGDYSEGHEDLRDYSPPPFRHVTGAFLGRITRCGTRWQTEGTPEGMTR
jgi:hypothetical protein